ncbi:MAG: twin-arginine translocase subunit TatC [Syntrophomonas sp.]|nr:twin-arginine translocase subunit TatC [Syntrophomonas sp.]
MAFKKLSADEKQTILEHLEELRKSIIISLTAVLIAAVACFSFNEQLLSIVTQPLRSIDQILIVTAVTEAFFVKLHISIWAGFVIAFPIVAWSVWRFIKPALYPHEKKYIYILFPITVILFALGVLFAYFAVLPLVLNFFVYIAGENLETMFKVDQYVAFVMSFTIPFGLVFELPVITFFLTKLGIINPDMLTRNRKYAILVIVILAGVLTPGPDPVSQMLMAIPVYLLFEVSILISKLSKPGRNAEDDQDPEKLPAG